MKKYLNKFKEWLILWTWILVAFSIWTFAYSKIETVKSGDVLSADSYNKLVDRINDLELQNEWIYQNAFDTNEIWTGRYDTLTGKKYIVSGMILEKFEEANRERKQSNIESLELKKLLQ